VRKALRTTPSDSSALIYPSGGERDRTTARGASRSLAERHLVLLDGVRSRGRGGCLDASPCFPMRRAIADFLFHRGQRTVSVRRRPSAGGLTQARLEERRLEPLGRATRSRWCSFAATSGRARVSAQYWGASPRTARCGHVGRSVSTSRRYAPRLGIAQLTARDQRDDGRVSMGGFVAAAEEPVLARMTWRRRAAARAARDSSRA